MSSASEAPRFGDEDPDQFAPSRPKKSRVWLWVLLIIGGGSAFACCGCAGFLYYMVGDMTVDPVAVKKRSDEQIVALEPPARLEPKLFMNIRGANFQMAMFFVDGDPDKGMLMLMRMPADTDKFGPEQHRKMQDQMTDQMNKQGHRVEFNAEESTTKKYTIRGKECDFVFAKGKGGHGEDMRQVMGVFPADKGTVVLMLLVRDEDYDEAAVDAMMKSIK